LLNLFKIRNIFICLIIKQNNFSKYLNLRKESNSSKKCKNCFQKKNKFQNSNFEKLNNLKNEIKNSGNNHISIIEKGKNFITPSAAKEPFSELNNSKSEFINENTVKNNIIPHNEKNK